MTPLFESEGHAGGFMDSIRRVGGSLLGLLQTRAELFAVELQEEKLRAIRLLLWVVAALALGVAGLLTAMGVLALFLWEKAGYAGLIGLALFAGGLAAVILWSVRRRLVHGPLPFAGTVAEFKKDADALGLKK